MIDISDLLSVPFVDRGRDLNGLDCWGLVMVVMKKFGYDYPDFDISCKDSQSASDSRKNSFLENKFRLVKAQPGSVVGLYLDRTAPTLVAHFGVCLDHRKFIHILETRGVLVSDLQHPFFKNIIAGYYQWIF